MNSLPHPFIAIAGSVSLPAALLLAGLILAGIQIDWSGQIGPTTALPGPPTVSIAPSDFTYRLDGSFQRDGDPVDGPVLQTRLAAPLIIMQFQVSEADYARCVAQGACDAATPRNIGHGDIPVTGVNYGDAIRYAAWLSRQTGQVWSLPTDQEWAFAAGEQRPEEAVGVNDSANPALRWLADYDNEARRDKAGGRLPMPLGSFGTNGHGVADMAGNVWEWTQTCHRRVQVNAEGAILNQMQACSIRVLDGQHRAPMSVFVRDAKSGGCSVGTPPANFGFRLVRRPNWIERIQAMFRI